MSEVVVSKIARPRQQRAIAMRASLLAAVEDIVAAEGVDAITTTRVAAEMGVAVGTIYRYFEDRDAMLLAAYDDTVGRIVRSCRTELYALPDGVVADDAARRLLGLYLNAAEAIPAHPGLLAAMRRLRPVESDQSRNEDRIVTELIAPFLGRFMPKAAISPLRMHVMSTVVGTLVDLYLVTPDAADRKTIRNEIEAHVLFMVGRLG